VDRFGQASVDDANNDPGSADASGQLRYSPAGEYRSAFVVTFATTRSMSGGSPPAAVCAGHG
jgi:hypothetical protein